jgi:hypothetical protein
MTIVKSILLVRIAKSICSSAKLKNRKYSRRLRHVKEGEISNGKSSKTTCSNSAISINSNDSSHGKQAKLATLTRFPKKKLDSSEKKLIKRECKCKFHFQYIFYEIPHQDISIEL